MWFIYLISWLASFIQIIFMLISVAAGLFYLADLVEEYTEIAKRIIQWLIVGVFLIYIGLAIFEEMPAYIIICGILSQIVHMMILKDFPIVTLLSFPFITGIVLFFLNHYFTFMYFGETYYPLYEVLGFFTICLWLVPFALFISLSANDNVLPMFSQDHGNLSGIENDALGNYLSKKQKKKYGLLSLLHHIQELIIPRSKKMF